MLKFEHLFKSSDITPSVTKTASSSEDTASSNHRGEVFKTIFEDSIGSGTAAKNGNISPPSSLQQQAKEHRNLSGGSALILEGSKPTDQSIAEFAALQGIDPNILALIMRDSPTKSAPTVHNSNVRAKNVGTNSDFNNDLISSDHNNPMISVISVGALDALGEKGMAESSPATIWESEGVIKAENNLIPNLLDIAKVSQGKAGIAESESKSILDLHGRNLLGGESLNKEALFIGTQNKTVEQSSKLAHKTIIKFQNAVPIVGVQKLDMINLGVDADPATIWESEGVIKAENNLIPNLLDIAKVSQGKAGIAESESKSILDLHGRNLLGGESLNKEALFIGTQNKTVEQSSKLAHKTIIKFQNAVPIVGVQKLDMINLGVDAEEILSLLSSSGAGSVQASLSSPVRADTHTHLIANPMPDLRVDLTAKSFAETQVNTDQQQLIRRQDQYLEISRRLTEALGERLTAQISKGAWRVEMDLHPKSLGRIEINLEMKNGALEAYFNPSQNVTRELLQDTFEKLKDTLAQHGIDSAYVGLGSGKKQHSDGNPTDDTLVTKRDAETESDNLSISSSANKTHLSADGLDIQV